MLSPSSPLFLVLIIVPQLLHPGAHGFAVVFVGAYRAAAGLPSVQALRLLAFLVIGLLLEETSCHVHTTFMPGTYGILGVCFFRLRLPV